MGVGGAGVVQGYGREPDFTGQLDIWGLKPAGCAGWPGGQGMGPWPLAQDSGSTQEGTKL